MCVGLQNCTTGQMLNVLNMKLHMTKPSFVDVFILLIFSIAKGFILGVDLGFELICSNHK